MARSSPGHGTPSPSPVQKTPKAESMTPTANLSVFSGTRSSGRCSAKPNVATTKQAASAPRLAAPTRPRPAPTAITINTTSNIVHDLTTRGVGLRVLTGQVWGSALATKGFQNIGAIIPINRASGDDIGVIANLHLFLEDILLHSLGRPLSVSAAGEPHEHRNDLRILELLMLRAMLVVMAHLHLLHH